MRLCASLFGNIKSKFDISTTTLPKMEEVFASLNKGAQSSKFDISRAYLQMKQQSVHAKVYTPADASYKI